MASNRGPPDPWLQHTLDQHQRAIAQQREWQQREQQQHLIARQEAAETVFVQQQQRQQPSQLAGDHQHYDDLALPQQTIQPTRQHRAPPRPLTAVDPIQSTSFLAGPPNALEPSALDTLTHQLNPALPSAQPPPPPPTVFDPSLSFSQDGRNTSAGWPEQDANANDAVPAAEYLRLLNMDTTAAPRFVPAFISASQQQAIQDQVRPPPLPLVSPDGSIRSAESFFSPPENMRQLLPEFPMGGPPPGSVPIHQQPTQHPQQFAHLMYRQMVPSPPQQSLPTPPAHLTPADERTFTFAPSPHSSIPHSPAAESPGVAVPVPLPSSAPAAFATLPGPGMQLNLPPEATKPFYTPYRIPDGQLSYSAPPQSWAGPWPTPQHPVSSGMPVPFVPAPEQGWYPQSSPLGVTGLTAHLAAPQDGVTATKRSRTTINRQRSTSSINPTVSSPAPSSASLPETSSKSSKPTNENKRVTSDIEVHCLSCSRKIARLLRRGTSAQLAVPHEARFTCTDCIAAGHSPVPAKAPSSSSGTPSTPLEGPSAFATGVSIGGSSKAALVTLGDDPSPNSSKNSSSDKVATIARKGKRAKATSDASECSNCDVFTAHKIGMGAIVPLDSQSSIEFDVEMVCAKCDERYQRCSDCGGGGGKRIGVGKWRCKELFLPSRRTCQLGHVRLGAMSEMIYNVWDIAEVPPLEFGELVNKCGHLFTNTMMSSLAVPETLESLNAGIQSFEEVKHMAMQGWARMSQQMANYTQETSERRKYLGLRWCHPNPRKQNKTNKMSLDDVPKAPDGFVLRHSKELVGFCFAEYDFLLGSFFITVVVPWSTGETYDATTLLLSEMTERAEHDRERMNAARAIQGLEALPEIEHCWTMLFMNRESRLIHHLERRRQFMPLTEYLKAFPEADPSCFPPIRRTYIPEQMLSRWTILVRRLLGNDWSTGRSAKNAETTASGTQGKGRTLKQKELRARERREREAHQ